VDLVHADHLRVGDAERFGERAASGPRVNPAAKPAMPPSESGVIAPAEAAPAEIVRADGGSSTFSF
jgi:hypothetical protein